MKSALVTTTSENLQIGAGVLQRIGHTLGQIFKHSANEKRPTGEIADRMAEAIFRG